VALLHRNETKKPLRPRPGGAASAVVSTLRPRPVKKASPCQIACLAGTDVRGAVAILNQRAKLGLSDDQACEQAWNLIVETNPFPATTGRICPHRCEEGCTRHQKDGGVAVGAVERFLGDWALDRGLKLPGCPDRPIHRERVAIIGAGPAGLSCAYQLARRGYASTIFEGMPLPGGMLRYGIPAYRLPARVLEGEMRRVLDVGVELSTRTTIGRDVSLEELRKRYTAVFVAPGAAVSRDVDIPGTSGVGVFRAVDFFRDVARQEPPALGRHVVVVVTDGGDTVSKFTVHQALEAAQLADAVIYAIVVMPITNDAGRNIGGEHALDFMANGTGGRCFLPTVGAELDKAFTSIITELRTQYLLGYYPRDVPLSKDRFHRLEVRVTRPDLRVSARNGYYGEVEGGRGGPAEDHVTVSPDRQLKQKIKR